ncbi:MAG: carbon-nitrogen hydrolase family protein [Rubrobacteraceae bacterium]|nr:carbon-nitrogen hydrolase family protein [Rubrobacteraceae bacterium]
MARRTGDGTGERLRGGHPLVAALHLGPEPGDVAGNLLLAQSAITKTKRAHPALRWIVLPELFTTGYAGLSMVHHHAEDAENGPSARFFASLARRLDLYIAYGFPEKRRGDPGGISDSANLTGPRGLLLTYRKRQLVCTTGEPGVFVPGCEVPVVRAGGASVALVICWDLGSPEAVREAAFGGADLILAPAGWRYPWGRQYNLACAARALDNGVYLASANQLGVYPEASFDAPGGVYGPDGSRLSGSTGLDSVGEIDPCLPERWRTAFGNTPPEHGGTWAPQPFFQAPSSESAARNRATRNTLLPATSLPPEI